MRIYTGVGDEGRTALFDGSHVSKAEPRVDACGEVDELNATLGVALAAGLDDDLREMVTHLQRDLFAIGAQIADPRPGVADRVPKAALGGRTSSVSRGGSTAWRRRSRRSRSSFCQAASRPARRSIWRGRSAGGRSAGS